MEGVRVMTLRFLAPFASGFYLELLLLDVVWMPCHPYSKDPDKINCCLKISNFRPKAIFNIKILDFVNLSEISSDKELY